MKLIKNNAFQTPEECAKWLDEISYIEGSFATSNGAQWIRHLVQTIKEIKNETNSNFVK